MCPTVHITEIDMLGHLPIIILRNVTFKWRNLWPTTNFSFQGVEIVSTFATTYSASNSAWIYTSTQLHGVTTRNVIVYHY